MWATDQAKVNFSFFFDRMSLVVIEVLEPLPFEEEERAWRSLTIRDPFEVRFDPPFRHAHLEEVEKGNVKGKGKGKEKSKNVAAKLKKVVQKTICRDAEVAGPSHSGGRHAREVSDSEREIRLKFGNDRPAQKRRREGSIPRPGQRECCLHRRPCPDHAYRGGLLELINGRLQPERGKIAELMDGHLSKFMKDCMGLFGARVQTPGCHGMGVSNPVRRPRAPSSPGPAYPTYACKLVSPCHGLIREAALASDQLCPTCNDPLHSQVLDQRQALRT